LFWAASAGSSTVNVNVTGVATAPLVVVVKV